MTAEIENETEEDEDTSFLDTFVTWDEQRRYEYCVSKLPKTCDLIYVDREAHITPKEFGSIFEQPQKLYDFQDDIYESYREHRDESTEDIIKENLRDIFDYIKEEDIDLLVNLKMHLEEIDESDPIPDLLRNTSKMLVRYRLTTNDGFIGNDISLYGDALRTQTITEDLRSLATTIGVPFHDYRTELFQLFRNVSYGGSPEILVYMDVKNLYDNLKVVGDEDQHEQWEITGTLTFENPHILVIDGYQGCGSSEQFKGAKITVPFDPTRIVIDEAQSNYNSYENIAGLYKPAFANPVSFTRYPEENPADANHEE